MKNQQLMRIIQFNKLTSIMLVHKFLMSGRMSKQLLLKIKEILKKMVLKNIISVAMQVMKFLKYFMEVEKSSRSLKIPFCCLMKKQLRGKSRHFGEKFAKQKL